MWSDTQDQPFAMGLRGTAIKRKLSEQDVGPPAAVAVAAQPHAPTKTARAEHWGAAETATDLGGTPTHHHHHQHHQHHHQQQHQQQQPQLQSYNGGGQQRFYCFDDYRQLQQQQQQQQQQQCYEQQQQQQTIRRDENGKSYLELGSWSGRSRVSSPASRCCEARTNWCVRGPACYRQRRLAVLNISMCKLGRYRQFSDPSLHRSVLICNTLRLIEKEMEQEGYFDATAASNGSNDVSSTGGSTEPQFPEVPVPYEPPRVPTPFPPSSSSSDSSSSSSSSVSSTTSSSSSSSSTSDDDRSINWGSVLSLSSQSDLDPLNNNDCLGGDSSSSDFNHDLDDFLPAWKAVDRHVSEPSGGELESIMHVLVGT